MGCEVHGASTPATVWYFQNRADQGPERLHQRDSFNLELTPTGVFDIWPTSVFAFLSFLVPLLPAALFITTFVLICGSQRYEHTTMNLPCAPQHRCDPDPHPSFCGRRRRSGRSGAALPCRDPPCHTPRGEADAWPVASKTWTDFSMTRNTSQQWSQHSPTTGAC